MANIAQRSSVVSSPLLLTSSKFLIQANSKLERNEKLSADTNDNAPDLLLRKNLSSLSTSTSTTTATATAANTETTRTETTTLSSSSSSPSSDSFDFSSTTQSNYQINRKNYNKTINNKNSNNTRLNQTNKKNHIIRSSGGNNSNINTTNTNSSAYLFESDESFSSSLSGKNATTATTSSSIQSGEQFRNMSAIDLAAIERERIRTEFYATYDVMTGVRIAATLGGFFGLMVFLIVYKSRSHSNETLKVLKDPKTAALAVACMQEEEDRKIIEAMDATGLSIFPDEYETILFRRQRMLSLGNVSAPPVLHRGFRFSSMGGGGYSSLLEPSPRRSSFSYGGPGSRRKSASESSRILSNYPMGSSFGTDDYFIETDDEVDNDCNHRDGTIMQNQGFLEVPPTGQDTRRSSAMTCCSTDSSYLERRCSAFTLGLNNLPQSLCKKPNITDSNGRQRSRHGSTSDWDYYYPDIQIIQATPKTSPSPGGNSIYDRIQSATNKTSQDTTTTAGISSIAIDTGDGGSGEYNYRKNSTLTSYDPESHQDNNLQSIGDSEDLISHQLRLESIGNRSSHLKRQQSLIRKENSHELKLMVNRNLSDVSSCTTTINNNMKKNQNGSSYNFSNNNGSITEHQTWMAEQQQNSNGICGTGIGRAPLASCSSFKMSSLDYQDSDFRSLGEDDSVFIESYADTDDDLEQFSTDSDELSLDIDDDDNVQHTKLHHPMPLQLKAKIAPPLPIIPDPNNQNNSVKSEPICREPVKKSTKEFKDPTSERHRTLSVSSNDKIELIRRASTSTEPKNKSKILETHFTTPRAEELLLKPNLASPLLILKRAQLQPQYSDPVSLPTTTTTTTTDDATTTTLETSSTEIHADETDDMIQSNATATTIIIDNKIANLDEGNLAAQQTHHLKKPSNFNYDSSISSKTSHKSSSSSNSSNKLNQNIFSKSSKNIKCSQSSQKNITVKITSDNKNLHKNITGSDNGNNGNGDGDDIFDSPNDSRQKEKIDSKKLKKNISKKSTLTTTMSPSVILELPVINLPTTSSSSSYHDDDDDIDCENDKSHGTCSEGTVRDPSLPSTSRKWSRETLF